jgi:hypothetical protein
LHGIEAKSSKKSQGKNIELSSVDNLVKKEGFRVSI